MQRLSVWITPLLGTLLLVPAFAPAQEFSTHRRVVARTTPDYPVLARTIKLRGVVKVEVLVSPDGSVKSLDVRGGHPLLAQAALDAVRRWKWEPEGHESHETVEVKFTP